MENKLKDYIFILFIGTWILFSITLIANDKYLFENIINIFILINILLIVISIILSIQTNKENAFYEKEKSLIDYIYKNTSNSLINYDNINEIIKDLININLTRKKLLIRIEEKIIQMKEKELKNIMMNNLKNNITKEQIKIILIGQKQLLENYKYELKATLILLDIKMI